MHRARVCLHDPPAHGSQPQNVRCRLSGRIAHARKGNRPRGDCFDVALYFIRPKGAATKQPRATPEVAVAKPSTEPCKGDTSPVGCSAPSGLFPSFFAVFRVPRALPWAVLSGPFGANEIQRNIKTCALGARQKQFPYDRMPVGYCNQPRETGTLQAFSRFRALTA